MPFTPQSTGIDDPKIIVPVLIGLASALVGLFAAIGTTLASYHLNKRVKRNEIYTKRSYDIAEKIARSMHILQDGYEYYEDFWESNYGHIEEFGRAISNFKSNTALFQRNYESIGECIKERRKLSQLLIGAWLYLPEKVLDPVKKYLDAGNFVHIVDATGDVNNLHEAFFENLLNKKAKNDREQFYAQTVKQMKSLKFTR